MKKLFFAASLIFMMHLSYGQLLNTFWKADSSLVQVLNNYYPMDSLLIYFNPNDSLHLVGYKDGIDSFNRHGYWSASNDTLIVAGIIDSTITTLCPVDTTVFRYTVSGNIMSLVMLNSQCSFAYSSFQGNWYGYSQITSVFSGEESKNRFRFYPNPVNDMLMAELFDADNAFINIYSLDGRLIISYRADARNATQKINTQKLFPGNYILTVISNKQVVDSRLMMKR